MRNASAVAHPVAHTSKRPHLVLVCHRAPDTPAPLRQRVAALLAGLICGFVLAALAAIVGGGSPGASLGIAASLGTVLVGVLAHARRVTVRTRRLARARRVTPAETTLVVLDSARAA